MRVIGHICRYHNEDPLKLNQGDIFVFGSNLGGRHGAGAAKTALEQYGAVYRQGIGMQGNSYAIPTKTANLAILPLSDIQKHVTDFVVFAKRSAHTDFYVTRIGYGYAGYSDADIAPLFKRAIGETDLLNVILPLPWRHFIEKQ